MNFVNWLIYGLRLGSIYALIALGYNMVYGIVKLINFAHGDIVMVGAYSAWLVITMMGVPFWVSVLVAMVICAIFGLSIEFLAYRPLRKKNAPRISLLITALGISIFLQSLFLWIFKSDPKPFNPNFSLGFIEIASLRIDWMIVLTVVITLITMFALTQIVSHTKMGKAMRAVSEDSDAAQLMGINVNAIVSLTFAIGSILAGLGAAFYSLAYPQLDPYMGSLPGLKAFIAAVLGGIGSIPGAMLGGFALGIAESIFRGIMSSWADAFVFGILIIVLLLKPAGILGKNVSEKV